MSEPLEPPPMDAREALLKIVNGYMLSQCVYVAAKLGVADFLRQGPKTPAELAAATGVHSESLFRILRTLDSAGIFSESDLGQFELTPMAQFLCRDTPGSARAWRPCGARSSFGSRGETYCMRSKQASPRSSMYSRWTGQNTFPKTPVRRKYLTTRCDRFQPRSTPRPPLPMISRELARSPILEGEMAA